MDSGTGVAIFIAGQIIAACYWAVRQHTKLSVMRETIKSLEEKVESNKNEILRIRKSRHNMANHIMQVQSEVIQARSEVVLIRESVNSLAKRNS